jgi:predicted phage tail protein
MELTTVRLYGSVAEICELRELKLEVKSIAEVIKALVCNFPELKKEFDKPDSKYSILIGDSDIEESEMFNPYSKRQIIRIVPVVDGAGGVFKIVLGVALIWATGGFGAGTGLSFFTGAAAGSFAAGLGTVLGSIGMSLLLGGISSLFMSQPETPKPAEAPESTPSFYFRGAVNTTAQGQPVAVGYGELLIGSAVIGAGLTTVNI